MVKKKINVRGKIKPFSSPATSMNKVSHDRLKRRAGKLFSQSVLNEDTRFAKWKNTKTKTKLKSAKRKKK